MIFIGYRHDDGEHAWAVHPHPRLWFDQEAVFIDHDRLPTGQTFQPSLAAPLEKCRVFLALVGPHSFSARNRARPAATDRLPSGALSAALQPKIPILYGRGTLSPVLSR